MQASLQDKLQYLRNLIDTGWIKGVKAKDIFNNSTHPLGDYAVSFCLLGAMERVENCQGKPLVLDTPTYQAIKQFIPPRFSTVNGFNDSEATTKEIVLQVIDKAITNLQGST